MFTRAWAREREDSVPKSSKGYAKVHLTPCCDNWATLQLK